ncbi:DUF4145 domain-containing protein [Nocardia alni]|uniref:DUF4145 domain-containing protein n=1 Tax=Nocardia alni TaxID=2815723 RepID=UPI001C21C9CA|nr:DUF4145 domain-containing protein [Nocardia alni]
MASNGRVPSYEGDAFSCPYCNVYATQRWTDVEWPKWWNVKPRFYHGWKWSCCSHCDTLALWGHHQLLVWPNRTLPGPCANEDMPPEILATYEEARQVLAISPRAAAGLLRLALQNLIDTLEPGAGSVNDKIGRLVQRGLEPSAAKAMDILRVVGNNAVHPGRLDVDGDAELVPALFEILNLVVHHVLTRPRQVEALFETLPAGAREAIERRDEPKALPPGRSSRKGARSSSNRKSVAYRDQSDRAESAVDC